MKFLIAFFFFTLYLELGLDVLRLIGEWVNVELVIPFVCLYSSLIYNRKLLFL